MDTKALEKFCPWARVELIDAVRNRCIAFGLDDAGRSAAPRGSRIVNGTVLTDEQLAQRDNLIALIDELGYDALCEREAYTWFNRFAGIRYMELHGYLPSRVRMLSALDGSFDPECLRAVGELDLPGLDRDCALDLAAAGDDAELFRLILIAQCDQLADALPAVFDHVDDTDALLLPNGLLDRNEHNVLYRLVTDIPEETWDDVEVLGWMYQFYNANLKAEFFKSKRKAAPEDIAPATQLFTPEWIVRYMVDNSLGRLWMLNFPESRLRERAGAERPADRLMEYYIEPDGEHEDFLRISGPEDITFCDPACGSGHILVYAFKMLTAMYEERGYRTREIPELILTRNLSGMEIDERAAQIAQLALALCARELDRRFFGRGIVADVRVLSDIALDADELPETSALLHHRHGDLLDSLAHLGEVGSLLSVDEGELGCLRDDAATFAHMAEETGDVFLAATARKLAAAQEACEALSRRFDVVVANPPYMGSSSFNPFMGKWMKKRYPDVKSDLFAAFIVRTMDYANDHGEVGIMSPFVWMFIGSYEKLRNKLIDEKTITSLIQLEYSGFAGATVPICTFTYHNTHIDGYKGGYVRLSDFVGASVQGQKALEAIQNPACGWFYRADATTFHDIPGSPIAYWANSSLLTAFTQNKSAHKSLAFQSGLTTGANDVFMRLWWETSYDNLNLICCSDDAALESSLRWFPCNKGGGFRRWYGNNDTVINWEMGGYDLKHSTYPGTAIGDTSYYLRRCLTWGRITSSLFSMRYSPGGYIPEHACGVAYSKTGSYYDELWALAFYNSSPASAILNLISPTLNFTQGPVGSLPLLVTESSRSTVSSLAEEQVAISQSDWDSQETSWDFKRSPLI